MSTHNETRLGARVRTLRRREGMTQAELANALGISSSYLNLIENNKRPLTANVLIKLARRFDIDLAQFASDDDARLSSELMEVLADPVFDGHRLKGPDVREFVEAAPTAARAMRTLYRRYQEALDASRGLAEQVSAGQDAPRHGGRLPPEEVNDLVQANSNYFPTLEAVADTIREGAGLNETNLIYHDLVKYLSRVHRVSVVTMSHLQGESAVRRYDPERRVLRISPLLGPSSARFQLAHQIALLEASEAIGVILKQGHLTTDDSEVLARIALANYVAGAVLLPYDALFEEAEAVKYDVDLLSRRFHTTFEQTCHRLTCLRRPGAEGVAFHFVRVDIAGNISKRFSASGIPFARFSGACPRWAIFLAFHTPGTVRTQLSEMPDGSRYLCVSRTVTKHQGGFRSRPALQAVGLGCRASDAHRVVYGDQIDAAEAPAISIGVTCRLCDRKDCAERVLPSLGAPLRVDENLRALNLYALTRQP